MKPKAHARRQRWSRARSATRPSLTRIPPTTPASRPAPRPLAPPASPFGPRTPRPSHQQSKAPRCLPCSSPSLPPRSCELGLCSPWGHRELARSAKGPLRHSGRAWSLGPHDLPEFRTLNPQPQTPADPAALYPAAPPPHDATHPGGCRQVGRQGGPLLEGQGELGVAGDKVARICGSRGRGQGARRAPRVGVSGRCSLLSPHPKTHTPTMSLSPPPLHSRAHATRTHPVDRCARRRC